MYVRLNNLGKMGLRLITSHLLNYLGGAFRGNCLVNPGAFGTLVLRFHLTVVKPYLAYSLEFWKNLPSDYVITVFFLRSYASVFFASIHIAVQHSEL